MSRIYIYAFIFLCFIFASCENEVSFNPDNKEPKLVLNALLDAESTENYISVTLTGKSDITVIKNAKVLIYINNELKETATPIKLKNSTQTDCYLIKSSFKENDLIKIDVKTSDIKYHAWAEVRVPKRLEIDKVDTTSIKSEDQNLDQKNYLRYKIAFKDHLDEKNFYRLLIENKEIISWTNAKGKEETNIKRSYEMNIREDVVLTDGSPTTINDEKTGILLPAENKYGVFDDTRFTNSSYVMTVSAPKTSLGTQMKMKKTFYKADAIIHLMSISEKEYYYLKALNIYDSDNFIKDISEPIHFPTNVKGGIGILGVSVEHNKTINLYEYLSK